MRVGRRQVLQGGSAAAIAGSLHAFTVNAAGAHPDGLDDNGKHKGHNHGGYGPLADVADEADGAVRLQLPDGFSYRSFGTVGTTMADGNPTPSRHDGMAAFKVRGGTRLVRNHEVRDSGAPIGDPALAYDTLATGGTTTVDVGRHGEDDEAFVSLGGTLFNCAGGKMPWGSWVTCEETVNGPDVGPDFRGTGGPPGDPENYPRPLNQPHGYIFEVPAKAKGQVAAVPIRSAGRFAHEACAYDARANALYMTEDNFGFPSGVYRYIPPTNANAVHRIDDGGELQMLKAVGIDCADMAFGNSTGDEWAVEWVTIADPDPTFVGVVDNDDAIQAVGLQGFAQGAAKFSRVEGCVKDDTYLYFACTQGGPSPAGEPIEFGYGDGRGQLFRLDLRTMTLKLLFQSPSMSVLDLPDNVVISPKGALLMCEDNTPDNFLRGLTPDGDLFDFCKNVVPGGDEEFAGATFDKAGDTLYVNIQGRVGISFAIWGPWYRGPL